MKNLLTALFFVITFSTYSQTPITDYNFSEAIKTCLTMSPGDGMCSSSEYGAMPDWDVSSVTVMKEAFNNKLEFNGDISSWDVSSVTNMQTMFRLSAFNQDISSWDVSNVTNMYSMFIYSPFNQNISSWDVNNVTNMQSMFFNAPF